MNKYRFFLLIASVPLIFSCVERLSDQNLFTAGGEIKTPVPIVPSLMSALRQDPAFQTIFANITSENGDLSASEVHLCESNQQDFIVAGRVGLQNVASDAVPFWVVQQNGKSFDVLNNFGGQELEIKTTRTSNCEDLELHSSAPNGGKFIISYKFDAAAKKYVWAGASIQR